MKKILTMIILSVMIIAPSAFASGGGKPKIAVYVTGGEDDGKDRALASRVLNAIVKGGKYDAVERAEAFLAEIEKEHITQRSGAIDDAQISALGKQSGVRYICVVEITPALGSYNISARIIDVETADVVASGVASSPLKTMADLNKASSDLAADMFGLPERGKRVRFSARLAYNNAYLTNTTISYYKDDFMGIGVYEETEENKFGPGSGAELSAAAEINIVPPLSVVAGIGVAYRKPVTTDMCSVDEIAVVAPIALRVKVANTPLFVDIGGQIDLPFNTKAKWKVEGAPEIEGRSSLDVGGAAGVGYRITDNIMIDVRGVIGLTPFDDSDDDRKVYQVSVGVGYQF